MNRVLKAILCCLINKSKFGESHTPEDRLIKPKIKYINSSERKEFEKEYQQMIKQGIILRVKKRTGKGTDWHISLDSHKTEELNRLLNN